MFPNSLRVGWRSKCAALLASHMILFFSFTIQLHEMNIFLRYRSRR